MSEKSRDVWMVWYIREGFYPALRAICLTEKGADVVKESIELGFKQKSEPVGTVVIEKNITAHIFGMVDYDISRLMLHKFAHERKLNGD